MGNLKTFGLQILLSLSHCKVEDKIHRLSNLSHGTVEEDKIHRLLS